MPLVSVIIPNYNHGSYLPKRIETVIDQTFRDIEILILDDCSSDNSREIIEKYASIDDRIKCIYNEANSGSTFKQWNKGAKMAKGKFLWFAESDDFSDLNFLAECISVLNENQQIAFVYANSNIINDNNEIIATANDWVKELDSQKWETNYMNIGNLEAIDFLMYRNFIPNASAVVMQRDLYKRVGGANESMKLCGDWLLYVKLLEMGNIAYLSRPLNYYRVHNSTVRSKLFLSYKGLDEIFLVLFYVMNTKKVKIENLNSLKFNYISFVWIEALMKARLNLQELQKLFKFYKFINQVDSSLNKKILKGYFNLIKSIAKNFIRFN